MVTMIAKVMEFSLFSLDDVQCAVMFPRFPFRTWMCASMDVGQTEDEEMEKEDEYEAAVG